MEISSRINIMLFFLSLLILSATVASKISAWSNGGYSSDPSNPDYETHDWIAQHALDWLPDAEKLAIQICLFGCLFSENMFVHYL